MHKEKKYTIGVSCIGSGVGQSVINALRLSSLPVQTVGFGTNPFAYGLYDCDSYEFTKDIYDPGYVDDLIGKCQQRGVDLIIPGLDDEALIIAQHAQQFQDAGIAAIVADERLIAICRDKERTCSYFNSIEQVFVRSFSLHSVDNAIAEGVISYPLIAKPRRGSASRKIVILREAADVKGLSDEYIVQELAVPLESDPHYPFFMEQIAKQLNPQVAELSVQLVFGRDQHLLGRMMSYHRLNNGVPIEIVPYDDPEVWRAVDRLIPEFMDLGVRGPLNLQGRMTKHGVRFFEINPRFTGVTGIRALMGFNEVEACVKDWRGVTPDLRMLGSNTGRVGIRQTADRVVSVDRNPALHEVSARIAGFSRPPSQRTLLITGACGYIGRNVIKELSANGTFRVWAFGRDKERTRVLLDGRVERIFDDHDFVTGGIPWGQIDILLHLGFTRPHGSDEQIADSLRFTSDVFTAAVAHQVPAIINMSSQSVYGLSTDPPWSERTPIAPAMVYASAKYAAELFLERMTALHRMVHSCSIRLGAVTGGAEGLQESDVLATLTRTALSGEPISIIGGMQQLERLDIRDAVSAIVALLNSAPERWSNVYNLSSGQVVTLTEIAEKVVTIARKYNGNKASRIITEAKEVRMKFGMDCSLFRKDMQWSASYTLDETIESLVQFFIGLDASSPSHWPKGEFADR